MPLMRHQPNTFAMCEILGVLYIRAFDRVGWPPASSILRSVYVLVHVMCVLTFGARSTFLI